MLFQSRIFSIGNLETSLISSLLLAQFGLQSRSKWRTGCIEKNTAEISLIANLCEALLLCSFGAPNIGMNPCVFASYNFWSNFRYYSVFVTYKFVINKYSKLGNFNFGVLWDPVLKAFPCVAHLGLASAWGLYSHSNIVENQIVLFLVLNGFISSYIVVSNLARAIYCNEKN